MPTRFDIGSRSEVDVSGLGSRLRRPRNEKTAFPPQVTEVRTPSARRESDRGVPAQPTLARAGAILLEAAASTNASISCMSSEMFPSFSGCHCTPVTHQE